MNNNTDSIARLAEIQKRRDAVSTLSGASLTTRLCASGISTSGLMKATY